MSEQKQTFDRSKFKSSSNASMVQQDKELDKKLGRTNGAGAGFLSIDEGKNIIRFYPAHPTDNEEADPFTHPKTVNWLMVEQDVKDEKGNVVTEGGKVKRALKAKNIFNSRIHGGYEKDLTDEYIKFVTDLAKQTYPGDDNDKTIRDKRQKFLEPIYGNFAKKQNGIAYRSSYVAYANKITNPGPNQKIEFGRIEFGKSVKERLNKLANSSESADEALSTDPFTDTIDGIAVVITKDSVAGKLNPNNYYSTEMDAVKVQEKLEGGRTIQVTRTFPLTDKELQHFMEMPSLKKMFTDVFKKRDFNFQLEGLMNFDKENDYHVFSYDKFKEIVEEIAEYFPEEENTSGTNVEGVGESNSGDMFEIMSREELKKYASEHELGILITSKVSDKELEILVREASKALSISSTGEEEEEEEGTQEEQGSDTETSNTSEEDTATAMKAKLAALRAKVSN